jgi:hypothetical protein
MLLYFLASVKDGETKNRGGTESWGDLWCFLHVLRRVGRERENYSMRIAGFFRPGFAVFRNHAGSRTILKSAADGRARAGTGGAGAHGIIVFSRRTDGPGLGLVQKDTRGATGGQLT